MPPVVRKSASSLTELLARALRDRGREVEVEHLHVHLPRVLKAPTGPRTANLHPDTDRLDAIESRLQPVPDEWLQRDGDAGLIEDAEGQPIAILGTSGDVRLPLGEFFANAPVDTQWLAQQLRRAWTQLDKLRDRIDNAGSLMDTNHVATAIDYVRGSREHA